ncbi:hypothetical protein B9P86_28455 [Citrobacter freundii]|nr:hypothetical protein B9P86_28455 [Citrobacter freundii]
MIAPRILKIGRNYARLSLFAFVAPAWFAFIGLPNGKEGASLIFTALLISLTLTSHLPFYGTGLPLLRNTALTPAPSMLYLSRICRVGFFTWLSMLAVLRLTISAILSLCLLDGLKQAVSGVTAVIGPSTSLLTWKPLTRLSARLGAFVVAGAKLMPGRLISAIAHVGFCLLAGCSSVTIAGSLRFAVFLSGSLWIFP